jgi:hypothetical protein
MTLSLISAESGARQRNTGEENEQFDEGEFSFHNFTFLCLIVGTVKRFVDNYLALTTKRLT